MVIRHNDGIPWTIREYEIQIDTLKRELHYAWTLYKKNIKELIARCEAAEARIDDYRNQFAIETKNEGNPLV